MSEAIARIGKRYLKGSDGNETALTRTLDAFMNIVARTGAGTPSLLEGTEYPLTRMSRNYMLLNSLYRSHWIVRKVVDTMPEDMLAKPPVLTCTLPPAELMDFYRVLANTMTWPKFRKGMKWGRLYGGSIAVIIIKGHGGRLDKPLKLDQVPIDSYRGLLIFDRWAGAVPSGEISEDIDDPPNFGLPLYYNVRTQSGKEYKVHCSRCIRFTGRDLPVWEEQAEMNWGMSEIELLFEELRKRDNTSWNIANLVFRANLIGLKTKDGDQVNATAPAQVQQRQQAMLQQQNHLMSSQGLLLLGIEGGLEQATYTFSGLSDIYVNQMLDICGCTEYPMTKLFGRGASGLSATGEGDERNYEQLLAQKQQREMDPGVTWLFRIVAMSTWGMVPDDLGQSYPPITQLSGKEQAELAKAVSDTVNTTFTNGGISRRTLLLELRKQSTITGIWTTITDADIAAASDKIEIGLDLPGLPPGDEEMDGKGPQGDEADGKDEE